ncbi:MAG TPA: hypothetical protein VMY43_09150 [Methanothrix sp.]|nr:hypothetical protein [Methanothrix sp.]
MKAYRRVHWDRLRMRSRPWKAAAQAKDRRCNAISQSCFFTHSDISPMTDVNGS